MHVESGATVTSRPFLLVSKKEQYFNNKGRGWGCGASGLTNLADNPELHVKLARKRKTEDAIAPVAKKHRYEMPTAAPATTFNVPLMADMPYMESLLHLQQADIVKDFLADSAVLPLPDVAGQPQLSLLQSAARSFTMHVRFQDDIRPFMIPTEHMTFENLLHSALITFNINGSSNDFELQLPGTPFSSSQAS